MEKFLFSVFYSICRIVNVVSTAEGRTSFAGCKSSVSCYGLLVLERGRFGSRCASSRPVLSLELVTNRGEVCIDRLALERSV